MEAFMLLNDLSVEFESIRKDAKGASYVVTLILKEGAQSLASIPVFVDGREGQKLDQYMTNAEAKLMAKLGQMAREYDDRVRLSGHRPTRASAFPISN